MQQCLTEAIADADADEMCFSPSGNVRNVKLNLTAQRGASKEEWVQQKRVGGADGSDAIVKFGQVEIRQQFDWGVQRPQSGPVAMQEQAG